jgi:hypothetical protein
MGLQRMNFNKGLIKVVEIHEEVILPPCQVKQFVVNQADELLFYKTYSSVTEEVMERLQGIDSLVGHYQILSSTMYEPLSLVFAIPIRVVARWTGIKGTLRILYAEI